MTDEPDNPITRFRPWLRSSANGINYEEFKEECEEINMHDVIENVIKSGFYKDGLGNSRKLPSSESDRDFIFKAISKRYRKASKRLKNQLGC